ncbi:MAG: D-alanyl-D-alanine carboxypeptidase, partial [Bdellovibrionales bacterium]|nr:D-alanyl-D-alanine carboxypeptidase [Bdellovibrionales bacterium]
STSLFTHQSKPLSRILRDLNHYSSNFIAEQVLLILGGDTLSGFDRDVGLEQLSKYLHRLGVPEGEYSLHDASGLSHSNRITPMAIANAIAKMYGEEEYRVEFERSLAVDSRSGTLQKRRMEGVVRAKTGTIDGVSSLAGIVRNKYGRLLAFVLLQNSVRSRADAHRFEEKLVRYLYRSQS